jgi:hypothetical protein
LGGGPKHHQNYHWAGAGGGPPAPPICSLGRLDRMTEAEWQEGTDPEPMLLHLGAAAPARKLRLYACAWCRDVWHLLGDPRSREAVATAERFADGLATPADLTAAFSAAQKAWKELSVVLGGRHGKWVKSQGGRRAENEAAAVARDAADPAWSVEKATRPVWRLNGRERYRLAGHLRDLFGSPFRRPAVEPACLAWNGWTVPKVARAIYAEGAFGHLPVLADALEEAGSRGAMARCAGSRGRCTTSAPLTASRSWPTRWRTRAAPTRTSWTTAETAAGMFAAAGSWTCCWGGSSTPSPRGGGWTGRVGHRCRGPCWGRLLPHL